MGVCSRVVICSFLARFIQKFYGALCHKDVAASEGQRPFCAQHLKREERLSAPFSQLKTPQRCFLRLPELLDSTRYKVYE